MLDLSATTNRDDRIWLLVDDAEALVKHLARAMEKRGFLPKTAQTVAAGRAISLSRPPAYAVVDLWLEDGSGLDVVEALRKRQPDCRTQPDTGPPAPDNPMSADRVRWENIQRIYELCDRKVSETARRLTMHRRTLRRILVKRRPVQEVYFSAHNSRQCHQ